MTNTMHTDSLDRNYLRSDKFVVSPVFYFNIPKIEKIFGTSTPERKENIESVASFSPNLSRHRSVKASISYQFPVK